MKVAKAEQRRWKLPAGMEHPLMIDVRGTRGRGGGVHMARVVRAGENRAGRRTGQDFSCYALKPAQWSTQSTASRALSIERIRSGCPGQRGRGRVRLNHP